MTISAIWKTYTLGELAEYINGRAFKPEDWSIAGLPIVRIQNLNDPTKPFNYYAGTFSEKHKIHSGDVLLSWSGTPGTSFGCFIWERGEALLNQHIFKVKVKEDLVLREYFVYATNSRLDEMIGLAHGAAGLRHITKAKLETIEIPVPSIEEQRRIVTRIKDCMERVDEIEGLRSATFQEASAILPSVLNEVFASQASTAPMMTIADIAMETRYGTSQKCHAEPTGLPILRIPNVARGSVNIDDLKYCNLTAAETERVLLSNGDLLFVRTNGSRDLVGRCAVFDGENQELTYGFASYLIRVRVDQAKVLPRYLSYFLNSTNGRSEIDSRRRTSAGQFNINSENLRSISFPVPTIAVQERLLEQMELREAHANQLTSELKAAKSESDRMREAILRKAFAGEL